MRSVMGEFTSANLAKLAIEKLLIEKEPDEEFRLLTTTLMTEQQETEAHETSEPSVGKILGSVLGGAIGFVGGTYIGSYFWAVYHNIPGISFIVAIGMFVGGMMGMYVGRNFFMRLEQRTAAIAEHSTPAEPPTVEAGLAQSNMVIAMTSSEHRIDMLSKRMIEMGAQSINIEPEHAGR